MQEHQKIFTNPKIPRIKVAIRQRNVNELFKSTERKNFIISSNQQIIKNNELKFLPLHGLPIDNTGIKILAMKEFRIGHKELQPLKKIVKPITTPNSPISNQRFTGGCNYESPTNHNNNYFSKIKKNSILSLSQKKQEPLLPLLRITPLANTELNVTSYMENKEKITNFSALNISKVKKRINLKKQSANIPDSRIKFEFFSQNKDSNNIYLNFSQLQNKESDSMSESSETQLCARF